MPSCPECENVLDVELDEMEEGDVVACEECGTEFEVVGVEPLELARVDEELEEEARVRGALFDSFMRHAPYFTWITDKDENLIFTRMFPTRFKIILLIAIFPSRNAP